MRLIKYSLLVSVLYVFALPLVGQAKGNDRTENVVAGIIEIGYVNPIYFDNNINLSRHENWTGFKLEGGICINRKVDIVFSYIKTRTMASRAYFEKSYSKHIATSAEVRYHFYLGSKLIISPKIGIGSSTWTNGIELEGQRYLFGSDVSFSIGTSFALKLKLDLILDSFEERLPETLELEFSGFFFQLGISVVGYVSG